MPKSILGVFHIVDCYGDFVRLGDGSCVRLVHQPSLSFDEAITVCAALGSKLIAIESQEKEGLIERYITEQSHDLGE